MNRILLWVAVAVFTVIGVYRTAQVVSVFYKDYQDFKVIRAWVVKEAKARQQAPSSNTVDLSVPPEKPK